jgi:acetyl esterase/lipase
MASPTTLQSNTVLITLVVCLASQPIATAGDAAWQIADERLADHDDENWPIPYDATGIKITRDIVLGSPGGRDITMDLFEPAKRDRAALPCIIVIHGGAWRFNEKEWFGPHAAYLARAGYVAVNINYRKLPDYSVRECVEDAKSAVRWVRKRAADIGVDPQRIGALGGSAGGHLAAVLATTEDATAKVDLAVGFATADLGHPALSNFVKEVGLTEADARELGAFPQIGTQSSPILLIHGTADDAVPVVVSKDLHARYQDRGASSELVLLDGYHHVFYVTPKSFFKSMRLARTFFDKRFGMSD